MRDGGRAVAVCDLHSHAAAAGRGQREGGVACPLRGHLADDNRPVAAADAGRVRRDDGDAARRQDEQLGRLHVAAQDVARHAVEHRLAHRAERGVARARPTLRQLHPQRKAHSLAGRHLRDRTPHCDDGLHGLLRLVAHGVAIEVHLRERHVGAHRV